MAMFDIEDSEDINLEGNKTDSNTLAKIKNSKKVNAKDNEANLGKEDPRKKWIRDHLWVMLFGVIGAVIAAGIIFKLGWN